MTGEGVRINIVSIHADDNARISARVNPARPFQFGNGVHPEDIQLNLETVQLFLTPAAARTIVVALEDALETVALAETDRA